MRWLRKLFGPARIAELRIWFIELRLWKKERSSLSDFKERNGFQRINLPRYYVPLTALGSAAFRLGMHHKLIDRLPEPLLAKARDFRYS